MTGSLCPGGLTHPQALLSLSVVSHGSLWASQWPGGPQFGFDGACPPTVGGCLSGVTFSEFLVETDSGSGGCVSPAAPELPQAGGRDSSDSGERLPVLVFYPCVLYLLWSPLNRGLYTN